MTLQKRYAVVQTAREIREAALTNALPLDLISEDGVLHADLRIRNVMHQPDRLIILATDPDRLKTVNVHVPLQGSDDSFEPYAAELRDPS